MRRLRKNSGTGNAVSPTNPWNLSASIRAHRWLLQQRGPPTTEGRVIYPNLDPVFSGVPGPNQFPDRSEEHTSELQSLTNLVCRLLLEKIYKPKSAAGTLRQDELTRISYLAGFYKPCTSFFPTIWRIFF